MRHCLAASSSLGTKGRNHEINYEKLDTYLISLVSFSIVPFKRETTIVIIIIVIITILFIITRSKLTKLAESWGQDTIQAGTFSDHILYIGKKSLSF